MALDPNEIASNAIIGVVSLTAGGIGAWIRGLVGKIHKSRADMNAAFIKIRDLEDEVDQLKEEFYGTASGHISEAGTKADDGVNRGEAEHFGGLGSLGADENDVRR